MLKDFNKIADMPQDVIDKYRDQVPSELLQIWQEDGLGTFLNGYLKVINPDDYSELVKETYFRGESSVPMFVTAFGDIIVLEKKDMPYKEFSEFLESFQPKDLQNLKDFFIDTARCEANIKAKCPKCKKTFETKQTGLLSFLI